MAAANLSHRYIADRFLPDKAIDLMDEATSRLAMELESVPGEIDEVQRRLVQLELADRQLAEETEEHAKRAPRRSARGNGRAAEETGRPPRAMGTRKERHWATCSRSNSDSMDAELQCNQLAASIKEKQSSGISGPRGRLPEALRARSEPQAPRRTVGQARSEPQGEKPAESAAACCAAKSDPRKSPRSSARGPAFPSRA